MSSAPQKQLRQWIGRGFSVVEDVVYIGLGILLAGVALALLVSTAITFGHNLWAHTSVTDIISLLDQILLILLVVELLYTVQVSFREHALIPEPFLIVGLIAAIRRVLVLTAEVSHVGVNAGTAGTYFLMELGVLTLLIMSLVLSLYVLQRRDGKNVASDGASGNLSQPSAELKDGPLTIGGGQTVDQRLHCRQG
jgi:uncharacterized membrane protein (DUF373 family)